MDSVGNVFVADYDNNRIRKVDTNGIITTVAGNGTYGFSGDGGLATVATMRYPSAVAVDSAGDLFIADYGNYRIRMVNANGIITTVAGKGSYGYSGDGGAATNAYITYPYGVAVDGAGNLYIADEANERIRKVGTNGIITTVAGKSGSGYSGDGGAAANALLSPPSGVAVDSTGNLFIADANNFRVRKVAANGIITTVAGNGYTGFSGDAGPATNASLYYPSGVAVDGGGNVFIADNYRVRKVVGNPAFSPLLSTLTLGNLATNNGGNYAVVVHDASGSITSTVAALTVTVQPVITAQPVSQIAAVGGNPAFLSAAGGLGSLTFQWYFLNPNQTPAGATALTYYGFTVAAVLTNGGSGYTTVPNVQVVGGGGSGAGGYATVSNGMVISITMTNAGSDYTNVPAIQINPPNLLTGQTSPTLNLNAVTTNNDGNYVVTVTNNYGSVTSQVATLTVAPCVITSQPTNQVAGIGWNPSFSVAVAGLGPFGYAWYFAGSNLVQSSPSSTLTVPGVSTNNAGNYLVVITNSYGSVTSQVATLTVVLPPTLTLQPASQTNLAGTTVGFNVAATGIGPFTYLWQFNGTNLPNNIITTVGGNGTAAFAGDGSAATNAGLYYPCGVAFDTIGNLYIGDTGNERIRRLDTKGIIWTVAGKSGAGYSGDGGAATNATLWYPAGVACDAFGDLFIDDQDNRCIREVATNGIINTVAGASGFSNPSRVILDTAGNLYISVSGANRILTVNASGFSATLAGNGNATYAGDGGAATSASIDYPIGMAFDAMGNFFISDNGNNRIRKVGTNGIITTVAGKTGSGFSGDGGAGTNANFSGPQEVALDASGNLYISDTVNNRIRRVDTNGIITTVAGKTGTGYSGDGGAATNALLNHPVGLAFDASGNLFIGDYLNNRVREVHFAGFPSFGLTGVTTTNAGNYSVVITSPYGSVTSLVATLTVTIPVTSPQIITSGANFGFTTNQPGFGFNLSGAFDQTIVVDNSTNLVNWTPLYTNIIGNNPVYFYDPTTTNFPARFYRARLQ